jgi:hypothetical protein
MTTERSAFSELDTKVHGIVCFGDGSVAGIEGCGTVLLQCKNGEHKAFPMVYLIPCVTASIMSLGHHGEVDGEGGAHTKPALRARAQHHTPCMSGDAGEQCGVEVACKVQSPQFQGASMAGRRQHGQWAASA